LLLYLNLDLLWPWLQQHGTPICYYQAALPCSPTRAFNPLPRNPAQTHVINLTAFHFYIYSYHFWRFILFNLVIPFLCTIPSSALGHHVTPLPMLSPLTSTHCPHTAHKPFQRFRISWLTWRINTSVTASSYTVIPKYKQSAQWMG
jgi:hypothetical protein